MLVTVRLLKGFNQPLTYSVPERLTAQVKIGALIEVPFRNQNMQALITEVLTSTKQDFSYTIKEIKSFYAFPRDTFYSSFLEQAGYYYGLEPLYFYKRLRSFLANEEKITDFLELSHDQETSEIKKVNLTEKQQEVAHAVCALSDTHDYKPALLHGVTGSGKTEIYKKIIDYVVFSKKKTVLLLLPEVSLAVQFAHLLKEQLNKDIPIFSFHSATGAQEKRDLWACLLAKKECLVIGVHLPIMLPIENLGYIILDEEHESGFQEKKHPKLHTKELALMRASLNKIPILLGSATPSISSLYSVRTKNWQLFQLHERFGGNFPTVQLVLLNNEKKRSTFWISKELETALAETMLKKEQAILFINRRGFSFFVQCKTCGFVFNCKHCSVSLTLHDSGIIMCHYCGYKEKEPSVCIGCKSDSSLIKKGIGTQQIVSLVQKLFPQARIARADLDTTVNKKKWQQTMHDFKAGEYDILVGTQTITKGYHFPRVTLVGVIWADLNLSMPFYTASEQTLQQLIQVAGRAGRQSDKSIVIVQALTEHALFAYLNEQRYSLYYEKEIENRKLALYPPCIRFAEIEIRHTLERHVDKDSAALFDILDGLVLEHSLSIHILGPTLPALARIKKIHMRKIYLKAASLTHILFVWHESHKRFSGASTLLFTPNPLS